MSKATLLRAAALATLLLAAATQASPCTLGGMRGLAEDAAVAVPAPSDAAKRAPLVPPAVAATAPSDAAKHAALAPPAAVPLPTQVEEEAVKQPAGKFTDSKEERLLEILRGGLQQRRCLLQGLAVACWRGLPSMGTGWPARLACGAGTDPPS